MPSAAVGMVGTAILCSERRPKCCFSSVMAHHKNA